MNWRFVSKNGLLFVFSLFVGWTAFFPGFMSVDSFSQYDIALTHKYSDWHPPIMSWVWSGLNHFFNGPQGLLFLHLSFFCAGLYLISFYFSRHRYAWVIWTVFYFPWVLSFAGVLWKDIGMAFSLLLAVAVGIQRKSVFNVVLFFALMFYAINLRYNAIFAAFPLMVLVVNGWWPSLLLWRNVCVSILALVGIIFLGGIFNYSFLNAEKTSPSSYMMVDDLAFLSIKQGASLIPDTKFEDIQRCATQVIGQGKLVGRGFCLPGGVEAGSVRTLNDRIKREWITQIAQHPLDYLQFRLAAFSYLIRSPEVGPYFIWQPGVDVNAMGIAGEAGIVTMLVENYVSVSADYAPFLFKPYWWLWLSSILLIGSLYAVKSRERIICQALLVSSILYVLGYIPLTAMADFRYTYWSVLATTVAFVLMAIGCKFDAPKNLRRDLLAAFALVCGSLLLFNFGAVFSVNTDALVLRNLPSAPVSLKEPSIVYQLEKTSPNIYALKGNDPQIIYSTSASNVRTEGRNLLAFDFGCEGSGVQPRMQIFWWGGQQEGPSENNSVTMVLHEGLNLIAIPGLSQFQGENVLKGLRFDLSNPEACAKISFANLSAYGI